MSEKKIRRAINISLQSKKYMDPINEMVQEWEENNLNISTETCEALLLVHKLKSFSTLSNILNIVNMLESLSSIYNYSEEDIDHMLNQIVSIDNEEFSKILIGLNTVGQEPKIKQKKEKKPEEKIEIPVKEKIEEKRVDEKKEIKIEEKPSEKMKRKIEEMKEETLEKTETINEVNETNDVNVPMSFLMNS